MKPLPDHYHRDYYRIRRQEVIDHYGGKCACCGETEPVFLTIDHINGGGGQHRKVVKNIQHWLRQNGFPKGFQILCFNCNYAKSRPGGCPHLKVLAK